MTNKKWLSSAANILLYAVGFPVLLIISLVYSLQWNKYGMYGVSSFAPLFAVLILWALTAGLQALVYFMYKKKGKTGMSLAVALVIIPVALIVGLFGIVDIAMPSILTDATSGTILYEDVVYDYQGMHDKIQERVDLFKKKNNLDDSVKFEDEAFQEIFKPLFASMDQAYNAFDKLAIEMALDSSDLMTAIADGKIPMNVLATLILPTAAGNDNNHNLTLKEVIDLNLLNIIKAALPLLGEGVELNNETLNEVLGKVMVVKTFDGISWNIFQILGENILFADIDPNAEIVKVTESGDVVKMGAALGYQDMSWLNGIPMMFFIPLMSMRDLLYLFAAIMAFCVLLQYVIASMYANKNKTKFSFFMLGKSKAEDVSDAPTAAYSYTASYGDQTLNE